MNDFIFCSTIVFSTSLLRKGGHSRVNAILSIFMWWSSGSSTRFLIQDFNRIKHQPYDLYLLLSDPRIMTLTEPICILIVLQIMILCYYIQTRVPYFSNVLPNR